MGISPSKPYDTIDYNGVYLNYNKYEIVGQRQDKFYEVHIKLNDDVPRPPIFFQVEKSQILHSYYEVFDDRRNKRLVLIGERHTQVLAPADRKSLIKSGIDHEVNDILRNFFQARKVKGITNHFMLEAPVRMRCEFVGGNIFDIDEETGEVVVDPTFETDVLEKPPEKPRKINVIDYISSQLTKQRQPVIPFDIRRGLYAQDLGVHLYQTEIIFEQLGVTEKTFEHAVARRKILLGIMRTVYQQVLYHINSENGGTEMYRAMVDRLRPHSPYCIVMLNQLLERMRFMYSFALTNIHKPVRLQDFRDLDKLTMEMLLQTREFIAHVVDFYAIGKYFEIPDRSFTVLYGGSAHVSFIARMLLSYDTGIRPIHVGERLIHERLTVPSPHELTTLGLMYAYSDFTATPEGLKLIPFVAENGHPPFGMEPGSLIFDDPSLSRHIMLSMNLPTSVFDVDHDSEDESESKSGGAAGGGGAR